jgi:nitrile hydratase subunit beta
LTLCAGGMGHWSIDESRHARETLHPVDYLSSSYYEIWMKGLQKLLMTHGFISDADLQAGVPVTPVVAQPRRRLLADQVAAVLARGGPTERAKSGAPRFAAGSRVRTVTMNPSGHTRLPRYARGRVGVVELLHGAHVFPDTSAHGRGEQPDWLYTVAFDARELWGRDADPASTVSIDAWEAYLEPA